MRIITGNLVYKENSLYRAPGWRRWGMVFGFFKKKKPNLKLQPDQEVEIEFSVGDQSENLFAGVLEVDKKRFTLKTPMKGKKPYPCSIGDTVTLVAFDGSSIQTFQSKIMEKRDREIDLLLPSEIDEEKIPHSESDYVIDAQVPVEFRAISTAHLQTAITREINSRGIKIVTSLPIPTGTILHLELEIPESPVIKAKGKVTESRKLPPDNKKSLTEIEFEDIGTKERDMVFRYTILSNHRKSRKQS
jgi:hypothetical protein